MDLKCNEQSIPIPVDLAIKHKFPCSNAVYRLREGVKKSVQGYLGTMFAYPVRQAIKWDGVSTVTIEVSFGKKPDDLTAIALRLADCLARIDAKEQEEAERTQAV